MIFDLSDNLTCLNGKLAALNKFINQLKELDSWVLNIKQEAEQINQKPFPENKFKTKKLHVSTCVTWITFNNNLLYLITSILYNVSF